MIKQNKRLDIVTKGSTALTDDLKALNYDLDKGFWCLASVEIPTGDSIGDIIKVQGVNWDMYHQPPNNKLCVFAQHMRELPDGKLPVIGNVEDHRLTMVNYNGTPCPALAVYVSWATDKDGNILELAKHYKDFVDSKRVNSVSVGVMYKTEDYTENEFGGKTIEKCIIYDLSIVTVGGNQAANILREMKSVLGDQFEWNDTEKKEEPNQQGRNIEHILVSVKAMEKMLANIQERCDVLESYALHANRASRVEQRQDEEKQLTTIQKKLEEIKDFLS